MIDAQPHISPIPAGQLTAAQRERWSALQKADPRLASPFLRPEFTLAAAEVFDNVEVAVFEQGGETVGFFPYQRVRGNLAIPAGGLMSLLQGVVLSPGVSFSATALMEACGLVSWNFNHLLADQAEFQRFHTVRAGAPYLDLAQGYDAYLAVQRQQSGKKDFFKQIARKTRQLDREIGPLRLDFASTDQQVLETLLQWKSDQYQRNKTANFVEFPGSRALLETVFNTHTPDFSPLLFALYAGDRLLAIEFCIRSGSALYAWVAAYDSTLPTKYSTGHSLTMRMAQEAPGLGIERIDLGRGLEAYKRFWTSATTEVAEGAIDMRPLSRMAKATWIRTRDWIRASPLQEPARRCKQVVRPFYERLVYRTARAATVQQR